jgi:hypothetical protein
MKARISGQRWPILLSIVIAGMALSGSQCAGVGDQVTGPNDNSGTLAESGGVSACVQACNEAARLARDEEKDLHKDNISACQTLRGDAKRECMEAEDARHDARLEEIDMAMEYCKSQCHEQGSGSGGQ